MLISLPLSSITDADIAVLSFWHLQDFCQAKAIDADDFEGEEEEVRDRVRVIILLPLSSITNAHIVSFLFGEKY
jgi:hypothetical protein